MQSHEDENENENRFEFQMKRNGNRYIPRSQCISSMG